jgi:hypothetical protein
VSAEGTAPVHEVALRADGDLVPPELTEALVVMQFVQGCASGGSVHEDTHTRSVFAPLTLAAGGMPPAYSDPAWLHVPSLVHAVEQQLAGESRAQDADENETYAAAFPSIVYGVL